MSSLQDARQTDTYNRLFDSDTTEIGRRIIGILGGHSGAVSATELAEQLAATTADSPTTETASGRKEHLLIRLHHLHLPKLADSGLVDWDRAEQTVAAADHPVYDADQPEAATATSFDSGRADDRRRDLLAIVEAENESISRADLARELASTAVDGRPTESFVDRVTHQLHHCDLPRLEEAGLVEYDLDAATVAYRGPTELTTALSDTATDD